VDQFTTLDPDSPEGHDYAFTEAAWDWIAIKGWPATPQLLFALKAYASDLDAKRNQSEKLASQFCNRIHSQKLVD
jgi:hypothetical protein